MQAIFFAFYVSVLFLAPINVFLLGNLEIIEGNSAKLECNYTDVNPKGNMSGFFYGPIQTIVEKVIT